MQIPTPTTASRTMYTMYPPATFHSNETANSADAMRGANERRMVATICARELVDESVAGRWELWTMYSWAEAISKSLNAFDLNK